MLYNVRTMCDEYGSGTMYPVTRHVDAKNMKEAREMVEYNMRAWDTPGYVTDVARIPNVSKSVKTVCYDQVKEWDDRMEAIAYFKQGWLECDGAEAERYQHVYADLWTGSPVGWDGVSEGFPEIEMRDEWMATTGE